MENRISGQTGVYALIGSPVGHSASPKMYNYCFEKLGLDCVYVAFDVKKDGVKEALDAMRLFKIRGINVTMPDKEAAAGFVDELSPAAKMIGAVNTIVNDDGKLIGHITDGEGFVNNLKDHGVSIIDKKIVVAGAGGAGKAIIAQCAIDGAKEVTILKRKNKTFDETIQMAEKIMCEVPGCKVRVCDIENDEMVRTFIASCDIFVNTTNVGMKPNQDESVIKDASILRSGLVVADIVYNPEETKLLKDARMAGCTCVGGKGMLIWQGASAFSLFTGLQMPVEEVKELLYGKQ